MAGNRVPTLSIGALIVVANSLELILFLEVLAIRHELDLDVTRRVLRSWSLVCWLGQHMLWMLDSRH